jgi:hypothetical protein
MSAVSKFSALLVLIPFGLIYFLNDIKNCSVGGCEVSVEELSRSKVNFLSYEYHHRVWSTLCCWSKEKVDAALCAIMPCPVRKHRDAESHCCPPFARRAVDRATEATWKVCILLFQKSALQQQNKDLDKLRKNGKDNAIEI